MHDVTSEKAGYKLDPVLLKEMPAADIHSGKLTLLCKKGHSTVVTLPIPDFELLFDFGCTALSEGYPREGITAFASSFERFQEFASRFLLARRNLNFEGVDAWWKEVKNQSERQLGSFVALWIAEFRSPPPVIPQKLVELRNDCVHKGRIPTDTKAAEFGEWVLRSLVGATVKLRNCFDSDLDYDDFVEHHVLRLDTDEPLLSFVGNTILSGMWRPNEPRPEEDEPDSGDSPENRTKNSTDPTTLTMEQALRTFAVLRAFGLRRK